MTEGLNQSIEDFKGYKPERCEHGVPLFIKCPKCWVENGGKLCIHGAAEGFCSKCDEITRREEYLKAIREHPEKWLKGYNIPPLYRRCSLNNFKGGNDLVAYCREYKKGDLVFYGKPGCGKTHTVVGIMREFVKADKHKGMWFETAPNLLMTIRDCFRDGSGSGETELEIIHRYSSIPFLVLDDLGSEKFSEFSMSTVFSIISNRQNNMLNTIITTNVPAEKFEEAFGPRMASRMASMKTIEISLPDYRKTRIISFD